MIRKFFFKVFKPFILSSVKGIAKEAYFKNLITMEINEKLDVPNLTEEQEEVLLKQVYDITATIAVAYIEKIN